MLKLIIGNETTEPLDFQFIKRFHDGTSEYEDLNNISSFELRMKPFSGGEVLSFTTNIAVLDADTGKIRVTFDSTDLTLTDVGYFCFFKLVDNSSNVIRYPSTSNLKILLIEDF